MLSDPTIHDPEKTFGLLHPSAIRDGHDIAAWMNRLKDERIQLFRGLNHRLDLERAEVASVSIETIELKTYGFRPSPNGQVFLNFTANGRPYFFASPIVVDLQGQMLVISRPQAIYYKERRDHTRFLSDGGDVELFAPDGSVVAGRVRDSSAAGLGISVPTTTWNANWRTLQAKIINGPLTGQAIDSNVRNSRPESDPGWTRIGLARGARVPDSLIAVEEHESIHTIDISFADSAALSGHLRSVDSRLVSFVNKFGRRIVGYVERNNIAGAPVAVLLHTGWGDTKESLLPLASTIIRTFTENNTPVVVLRFDGINQRGESFKESEAEGVGHEHDYFVFSQPVSDIDAAIDFLETEFRPVRRALVSHSIAALSGRKFLASDTQHRFDCWVCLVGASDLQSASRAISGGVDFSIGREQGLEFGFQELLGIRINADRMMEDAVEHGILHLEDARTDFASIAQPITWYHGKFDAWIDLDRVRDAFSHGDISNRRLVAIPTTHRLGWGSIASRIFADSASEIGRLSLGKAFVPVCADRKELGIKRRAERQRISAPRENLPEFWRDYLMGRDRSVGIELMTSCDPYERLMETQIRCLRIEKDNRIADLGCGTGALSLSLRSLSTVPEGLKVVSIDHVPDALRRAKTRNSLQPNPARQELTWLASNLDIDGESKGSIPIREGTMDRVLASLLLSYLTDAKKFLSEMYRVLRPGGRVVISSLLKDADISRLFVESLAEIQISDLEETLPELSKTSIHAVARNFLNDAARIIELESTGKFSFWDPAELVEMVRLAGFNQVTWELSFGEPAQAVVVTATK